VQISWVRDGGGTFNCAFPTPFQGSTSFSNTSPTSSGSSTTLQPYTYTCYIDGDPSKTVDPHVIVVGRGKNPRAKTAGK
jgi:hypothetical protein